MSRSKFLTSVSVFRWVTTALVILVIVMFFKQNIPTFVKLQDFSLNLYVAETVQWNLKLYVLLLIAAFIGFVLGFGIMLKFYLNTRRLLAYERMTREEGGMKPTQDETAASPSEGAGASEEVHPSSTNQ